MLAHHLHDGTKESLPVHNLVHDNMEKFYDMKRSLTRKRTFQVIALFALTLIVMSLIYWPIEGCTVGEAFYMYVMTMTTVGYTSAGPKTTGGQVMVVVIATTSMFLEALSLSYAMLWYVEWCQVKERRMVLDDLTVQGVELYPIEANNLRKRLTRHLKDSSYQLWFITGGFFMMLLFGTLIFMYAEHMTFMAALYMMSGCITTLGDTEPQIVSSKVLMSLFAVAAMWLKIYALCVICERSIANEKELLARAEDLGPDKTRAQRFRTAYLGLIITTVIVVGLFIGAAFLLNYCERWTINQAIYFLAVSLTTISLGDSLPSTDGGRAVVVVATNLILIYKFYFVGVIERWRVVRSFHLHHRGPLTESRLVHEATHSYGSTQVVPGVSTQSLFASANSDVTLIRYRERSRWVMLKQWWKLDRASKWQAFKAWSALHKEVLGLSFGFAVMILVGAAILAPLEERQIEESEGSGPTVVKETYARAVYFILMTLVSTSYLTLVVKSNVGKWMVILFSYAGLVLLFFVVDLVSTETSERMLARFKRMKQKLAQSGDQPIALSED